MPHSAVALSLVSVSRSRSTLPCPELQLRGPDCHVPVVGVHGWRTHGTWARTGARRRRRFLPCDGKVECGLPPSRPSAAPAARPLPTPPLPLRPTSPLVF
eukprot:2106041-Prymnesium_polylepis.1